MTAQAEVIDRDAFTEPKPSTASPQPAALPPKPPASKHSPRVRAVALAAGITEGEMEALTPDQLYHEIRAVQVSNEASRRPAPAAPPAPVPAAPAPPAEEAIDWGKDPNTGLAYTENDYSPAIRKAVKAAYAQDKKDKDIEELRAENKAIKEHIAKQSRQADGQAIEKVLGEFPHLFGTPEQRTPGSPQMAFAQLLGNMMHGMPDAERTTLEADLRKKIALLPGGTKAAPKPAPRQPIESPLATPDERTAMLTEQKQRAVQPRNEAGQFLSAEDLAASSVEAPSDRAIPEVPEVGRDAAVRAVAVKLRERGHYVPAPSPNGAEDLGIPE